MKLVWSYFILEAKEVLKHPGYVISTLIFPSLFFAVFAAPNVDDVASARQFAGSFAVFGVLGTVFFQFAIATANMRDQVGMF